MFFARLLFCGSLVLMLTGCDSTSSGVRETLHAAFMGVPEPSDKNLNPSFSYLRVTTATRVAYLALGYVDSHPQGPIEVWYSADFEVLRLQNGRVVGASGTLVEWRQVNVPELPSWQQLLAQNEVLTWLRVRDVMPGYQFSRQDRLQLSPMAPPDKSRLRRIAPVTLRWFEESFVAETPKGQRLPPARYALEVASGSARVVYGEQCLSADFCLTWQRWKPEP